MMIVFFKNVLLRYYFFHADDYLHWIMMLEDSGTDFFRLVDFSGSDSEPHFR